MSESVMEKEISVPEPSIPGIGDFSKPNLEVLDEKKQGVQDLISRDKLIRSGTIEILLVPHGGMLTTTGDGSFELQGAPSVNIRIENGATIINVSNVDSITLANGRISSVNRSNRVATILRNSEEQSNV